MWFRVLVYVATVILFMIYVILMVTFILHNIGGMQKQEDIEVIKSYVCIFIHAMSIIERKRI